MQPTTAAAARDESKPGPAGHYFSAVIASPSPRAQALLGGAVALLASVLVVMLMAAPHAAGATGTTGLWPTSFRAHETATDCGRWKLDHNGFCVANDSRNGLEIGVKFQTSRPIQITGVRIYRYDTATLTGSLWDGSGKLLARGTFAAGPASAWQDMTFRAPVTIAPGRTYVASYFSPNTKYAFQYQYFADSGRTVGPVTALRATATDPNGVHCYDDAVCGSFPVRAYRNSTYWVTPLWVESPATTATNARATAPRVAHVAPHGRTAKTTTAVRLTFSRAMRPGTLTRANVRLLWRHHRVSTRMTYRAATHRLVLKPRSNLRQNSTYRVEVSTHVRDAQGERLDQSPTRAYRQPGTWSFHTR